MGLTQADAAQKAGIERETWGKYERGVFLPSGDVLVSLLNIGIDISALFSISERQPENLLAQDEQKLLNNYRQASDNGKFVILSVAQGAEKSERSNHAE